MFFFTKTSIYTVYVLYAIVMCPLEHVQHNVCVSRAYNNDKTKHRPYLHRPSYISTFFTINSLLSNQHYIFFIRNKRKRNYINQLNQYYFITDTRNNWHLPIQPILSFVRLLTSSCKRCGRILTNKQTNSSKYINFLFIFYCK